MAVTREPFQIADISAQGAYESRIRGAMLESGTRSVLAIPLIHEDSLVGGLVVTRRAPGEFTTEVVGLLRNFATQSGLAIQNARLAAREARLKQEIHELRIEIDEAQKARHVSEITETDYFHALQQKARALRQRPTV